MEGTVENIASLELQGSQPIGIVEIGPTVFENNMGPLSDTVQVYSNVYDFEMCNGGGVVVVAGDTNWAFRIRSDGVDVCTTGTFFVTPEAIYVKIPVDQITRISQWYQGPHVYIDKRDRGGMIIGYIYDNPPSRISSQYATYARIPFASDSPSLPAIQDVLQIDFMDEVSSVDGDMYVQKMFELLNQAMRIVGGTKH